MTPLADSAVEGAMTVTTGGAVTGVWHGASRSRLVYAANAVSFMTVGVTLVTAVDTGMWQLVVFAVLPDVAILAGRGRGLARGQLHPRAVPLYNALVQLRVPRAGPEHHVGRDAGELEDVADHAVVLAGGDHERLVELTRLQRADDRYELDRLGPRADDDPEDQLRCRHPR